MTPVREERSLKEAPSSIRLKGRISRPQISRRFPCRVLPRPGSTGIPRKENGTFERAIGEIKAGRKSSCWMWFVIPSPPHMKNNVEHGSSMNRKSLGPRFACFASDAF